MIYEVCPTDETNISWLFYKQDIHGQLIIRDIYKDLICPVCGKFNEFDAINRGISPDFHIQSKNDWVSTSDYQICVTKKFKKTVEDNHIEGLDFISISKGSDHFVIICTYLTETDEKLAGFNYLKRCSHCGRYKEVIMGPLLEGMKIPQQLTFFVSEIANENIKVSYRPIFANDLIVNILNKAKIKGIDFVPAI